MAEFVLTFVGQDGGYDSVPGLLRGTLLVWLGW